MKDYSKLTALIIEDDPTNQVIAETLLKKIGVTCDLANNGEEAIQILKEKDYDFALMDINMPGMNGIEATRIAMQRTAGTGEARCPPDDVA